MQSSGAWLRSAGLPSESDTGRSLARRSEPGFGSRTTPQPLPGNSVGGDFAAYTPDNAPTTAERRRACALDRGWHGQRPRRTLRHGRLGSLPLRRRHQSESPPVEARYAIRFAHHEARHGGLHDVHLNVALLLDGVRRFVRRHEEGASRSPISSCAGTYSCNRRSGALTPWGRGGRTRHPLFVMSPSHHHCDPLPDGYGADSCPDEQ
jgi:hypothetical protein